MLFRSTEASQLHASNIAETATASEAITANFAYNGTISETASASDTITTIVSYYASLDESATGSDSNAAKVNFAVSVAEGVTASDADSAAAAFIVAILESVTASDQIDGRYLWEPINDDDTPDWTDILVATTIVDIGGFGGSPFASAPFAGAETTAISPVVGVWTQVNDDNTTTWTEIVT